MHAVILAGGKGTRLMPYTTILPKPLMPVGEMPILETVIRQLCFHGFNHITIAVGYLAELIEAYFGDGSKWGVVINYSRESKPLGTMGPLKLIDNLPENFLVMNGDILTDLSFSDFYREHCQNKRMFTVAAYHRDVKIDFGVVETDNSMKVTGFREKPSYGFDVSMGIYIVNRDITGLIPNNRSYGFDQLMLDLIGKNQNPYIYQHNGYWLDIGRLDDCERAVNEFDTIKDRLLNR